MSAADYGAEHFTNFININTSAKPRIAKKRAAKHRAVLWAYRFFLKFQTIIK